MFTYLILKLKDGELRMASTRLMASSNIIKWARANKAILVDHGSSTQMRKLHNDGARIKRLAPYAKQPNRWA